MAPAGRGRSKDHAGAQRGRTPGDPGIRQGRFLDQVGIAMAAGTITQTRIALDIQPPTARLTLQHPPLNVIDIAMMDELAQALAGIEARSDVSTVILSGAGKAFSVGVDVAAHTPDKVEGMLARFHA